MSDGWYGRTEAAHSYAVRAATEGLSDAALGGHRLHGSGVPLLAEAAVSSATAFLRAPLLAAVAEALALHTPESQSGDGGGTVAASCPTCGTASPCDTARALLPDGGQSSVRTE
ncbi:MAG: hypothetical protein M3P91_12575 [Actinomycetota bacterium]|nr:hypothetical protein [Actinomycetota bacterium]